MKIAIASGKGGTGKTILAVNLAMFAAEYTQILLADLDVEEPNSGIFIKGKLLNEKSISVKVPHWTEENCRTCGRCVELCRFNALIKLADKIIVLPELCHSCHACSELCPGSALPMQEKNVGVLKHFAAGNLQFIESKLNVGCERSTPLISQTINYLEEYSPETEFYFLDSPPGVSCPVIEVAYNSDFILLVTEPTPFGLYDLGLTVETMIKLDKPMAVIINRYGIGDDRVIRYCEQVNIPIWAFLPNKRYIAELYSSGELVYPHVPEFRQGLETILRNVRELDRGQCVRSS